MTFLLTFWTGCGGNRRLARPNVGAFLLSSLWACWHFQRTLPFWVAFAKDKGCGHFGSRRKGLCQIKLRLGRKAAFSAQMDLLQSRSCRRSDKPVRVIIPQHTGNKDLSDPKKDVLSTCIKVSVLRSRYLHHCIWRSSSGRGNTAYELLLPGFQRPRALFKLIADGLLFFFERKWRPLLERLWRKRFLLGLVYLADIFNCLNSACSHSRAWSRRLWGY